MSKIVLNLNYVPSQKYLSKSKQESTYNALYARSLIL